MHKISTFLWFNNNAEEAVEHYLSVFKNSRKLGQNHFPDESPEPTGKLMTISFELEGQTFTALNCGTSEKFNSTISLMVRCETQAEVDQIWDAFLDAGGQAEYCGWLKDKFGLSWQIVPAPLMEMWNDPDPQKTSRVMKAMRGMVKLDLAELNRAFHG
jgi:predicted 3-demethylubiquinone-9 3-methyltransferase (glyoxalase superfamily)